MGSRGRSWTTVYRLLSLAQSSRARVVALRQMHDPRSQRPTLRRIVLPTAPKPVLKNAPGMLPSVGRDAASKLRATSQRVDCQCALRSRHRATSKPCNDHRTRRDSLSTSLRLGSARSAHAFAQQRQRGLSNHVTHSGLRSFERRLGHLSPSPLQVPTQIFTARFRRAGDGVVTCYDECQRPQLFRKRLRGGTELWRHTGAAAVACSLRCHRGCYTSHTARSSFSAAHADANSA